MGKPPPPHSDEDYHQPESVEDLTRRNIEAIAQLEQAAHSQRTPADRIADAISDFAGSMYFVYLHLFWFVGWMLINTLPHGGKHFDPFPFTFLTFVVSLEAIFLSTFILISQNRQNRVAERRNHLDLQINLLSEQENSKMLAMLEAISHRLGVPDDDPEVRVLEEATRPDRLLEQIDRVIEETNKAEHGAGGSGSAER